MTQKKIQLPALVRIRDNQRRSRARRKEYTEDLEARLARFEQLGVQANVEIQAAARKVARENILLRELLGVKGVGRGEVEEYLRAGGEPARAPAVNESILLEELRRGESGGAYRTPRPTSKQPQNGMPRNDALIPEHSDPAIQAPRAAVQPTPISAEPDISLDERASSTPRNNLCRPSPTGTAQQRQSLDDVTSCEVAANIIASMRGHGDEEEARAELGCSPDSTCVVGNMTVFELLDR